MQTLQLDEFDVKSLLAAQSAANTAAATTPSGSWADLSQYEGDVAVVINIGALTGSINVKVQVGDDNTGANPVDAVDGRGIATGVKTGAGVFVLPIKKDQSKAFIGVVGTVVTGPVLVGVTLLGRKKVR